MIEAIEYDFMQHAIIGGILVSIIAGIVGSLVVVNRMVFLAGGIAHASYGGIGLALYFSLPIFLGASLFAVVSGLIVAHLSLYRNERIDTHIGLVWAVGMAIGILFTDLTPGYHADVMSYLFGSILAVDRSDLTVMTVTLVGGVLFVFFRYRQILAVSYDSEFALIRGIPVRLYYTAILIFASLGVVVAIKVVGLILVIALLTVPVYIAEKFVASLWKMMVLASLLAAFFTLGGLWLSYRFDLTSGATIVITSAIGMFIAHFIKPSHTKS